MWRKTLSIIGVVVLIAGLVSPGVVSADRGQGHGDKHDRGRPVKVDKDREDGDKHDRGQQAKADNDRKDGAKHDRGQQAKADDDREDGDDSGHGRPAKIEWQHDKVELSVQPGSSQTMTVHFRASQDIEHATMVVRPGQAPLEVAPRDLGSVKAGQDYAVTLTAHLAADEHRPHKRAQVFVQDGQRRLGPPLRVDIVNTQAGKEEAPAQLRWTPTVVMSTVQPGTTFSTTVSFVSNRDMEQAHVRVHTWFGLKLIGGGADLGHVAANQATTLVLSFRVPAETSFPILLARVTLVDRDDGKAAVPPLWLLLRVGQAEQPSGDQTAPTIEASQTPGANANGWNNGDVQVTLAARDNDAGSGVAEIKYRVNGGDEVRVAGATATIAVTTNGTWNITFRATDSAGNGSAEGSHTVRIDRAAPTISASQTPSANANGWNNGDVQVTLTAGDTEGGSGVAEIKYRVNGGEEVRLAGATAAITVTAEGSSNITFRAVDKAGNSSAEGSHTVRIDRTAPTVQASQTSPTEVVLTATDNAGGSGVAEIRYRIGGGAEQVVSAATATIVVTGTAASTISFRAADRAGNVSAEDSLVTHLQAMAALSAAPGEPAQPAEAVEAAQAAQPAEAAEPAQPAEPAPCMCVDSAQSAEPAQPADPGLATQSAEGAASASGEAYASGDLGGGTVQTDVDLYGLAGADTASSAATVQAGAGLGASVDVGCLP